MTPKPTEAFQAHRVRTSSGGAVQRLDDLSSGRFRHFTSDDLSYPCVPRGTAAIEVSSLRDRAVAWGPSEEEMPITRVGADEVWIGQYPSEQWRPISSGHSNDPLDVAKAFIGRHRVQGLCHPCSQFKGFMLFAPCRGAVGCIDGTEVVR